MTESRRPVCIHGHFYQPPRENPWSGEIDLQQSAAPYHDWNERVTAECYEPNASARILGPDGGVLKRIDNYSLISFNFGPTLLSWMEREHYFLYTKIIESDNKSRKRFSGHGGAIAQCYSHMIMPLASARDKKTQVLWGVSDFKHRFGRKPEGMWLPETAVDTETLEIMADEGILFTILTPHQALEVRGHGGKWRDVSGGGIDTSVPYVCYLPSGREIAIFFYDGAIAHEIAFGDLLRDGAVLASRLAGTGNAVGKSPGLSHAAVDGETFGHHHKFGEMALAYCLESIEAGMEAQLTVYGEHLDRFPPQNEVRIAENTSWSCVHGVERWRSDCGCTAGGHPEWNQKWRAPLREALDGLRKVLDPLFEEKGSGFFPDPWEARDGYMDRILSGESKALPEEAHDLLEMQRFSMLMFTSCGWFFDDISRIETLQILRYAARAIEIAEKISGASIEAPFIDVLEKVPGNTAEIKNGRIAYEKSKGANKG